MQLLFNYICNNYDENIPLAIYLHLNWCHEIIWDPSRDVAPPDHIFWKHRSKLCSHQLNSDLFCWRTHLKIKIRMFGFFLINNYLLYL